MFVQMYRGALKYVRRVYISHHKSGTAYSRIQQYDIQSRMQLYYYMKLRAAFDFFQRPLHIAPFPPLRT